MYYDAVEMEDNIFEVQMPKITKAKEYEFDAYIGDNLVATGLTFKVKKESSQEKDLL